MISYLLEVNICWGLFYLLYWSTLSKETYFGLNRLYLLSSLILGLLLPLISFHSNFPLESSDFAYYLAPITVGVQSIESTLLTPDKATTFGLIHAIQLVYSIGVFFGISRFIWGLKQLIVLWKTGEKVKKQGYTLLLTKQLHLPFSFFHIMVWSKQYTSSQEDIRKITIHELAHIKGWHSLDIIFLELLSIFLWWSPFVYLYCQSIRNIHEYLADAQVLQSAQLKKYGQLLIKQSQSGLQIAFANHFFQSQLKKRFFMMKKSKSNKGVLLKYLLVLPILAFLLILWSKPDVYGQNANPVTQAAKEQSKLHKVVDEMPRFPGCESLENKRGKKLCSNKKLREFISTKLKYPKEAWEANIQGTVILSFVIDKDGSIIGAEVKNEIGGGCGKEALRVLGAMPNWVPGKIRGKAVGVQMNLPVKFRL